MNENNRQKKVDEEVLKKQAEALAKKNQILSAYISLIDEGLLFPTRAEMKALGFSRDLIRYHFGNMSKLRLDAKELFPKSFEGNIDVEDYISEEYLAELKADIKKHKTFIITTAVSGQKAHDGFIESMRYFCKINKAKLLIIPSHDPAHNLDNEIEWHFTPSLLDDALVFEDTPLNSNIFISGIRTTAKQINPITGLSEISQQEGSFISASPKQFLEYDAVSANKLPHGRMTTGACTLPNYKSTRGNSLRTAYIAHHQHTLGAVIIEVRDGNTYHPTQIQADENGSFCHYGVEYKKSSHRKLVGKEAPVLVMGDYHAGEHDEGAVSAWIDVINSLGVQEVVFHDMFNAVSVNHHEEDDMILRAERADKGLNSLRNELCVTADQFDRIMSLKSIKKGVVVKSNHDDMLDRWLKKAKFAKDPVNFSVGVKLAAALVGTKKDYLREALCLVKKPKHFDKLQWLTTEEDYMVGDVNVGAHGDKASNGTKGSIKGMTRSYPKCIIGHSHTPGIFKRTFQVGTTSLLRLGYNKGPSSWVHCSCLVYRNGQRQLINSIDGKWRLEQTIKNAVSNEYKKPRNRKN